MPMSELLSDFGTDLGDGVAQPCIWIGAASFEERCLTSGKTLDRLGIVPEKFILLDYTSTVRPIEPAERIRAKHKRSFVRLAGTDEKAEFHSLHPYQPGPLLRLLDSSELAVSAKTAIFDITCMTKMHTLALADWLVNDANLEHCVIAYSVPDQYLSPSRYLSPGGRWLEVVVSPLRFSPMSYQKYSNGIILPGHDGGRLLLALDELEVNDAMVLVSSTAGRERLSLVEHSRNLWLYNEIEFGTLRHWAVQRVSLLEAVLVQQLVTLMANKSIEEDRRLALFPFGPKPGLFAAAVAASARCPERIWYSYPIPISYDLEYTLGGGLTYWASFARS